MKFKLVEETQTILEKYQDLDEVYFTPYNLDRHYYKHCVSDDDGPLKIVGVSKEQYNQMADDLSSADASKLNDRSARIIGYITKNGRTVKHDKETKLTVVYVDDDEKGHEAIALYKQPTGKFFTKLNRPDGDMSFGKNIR